jgi:choline dehydrogenase
MLRSFLFASVLYAAALAVPASNSFEKRANTFGYVIVGGGTAGLTLAERLTEDSSITVAVIEASTYYQITDPLLSTTPAGDVVFVGSDISDNNPLIDWSFVTVPQASANGRTLHYARGKCLGGSSARNFMIFQRDTRGSYQPWADAVGDQSYTFDNWLPYFKKSVSFTPPKSPPRAAHATAEYNPAAFETNGGPLDVFYAH